MCHRRSLAEAAKNETSCNAGLLMGSASVQRGRSGLEGLDVVITRVIRLLFCFLSSLYVCCFFSSFLAEFFRPKNKMRGRFLKDLKHNILVLEYFCEV
jgi:hypothetical protein